MEISSEQEKVLTAFRLSLEKMFAEARQKLNEAGRFIAQLMKKITPPGGMVWFETLRFCTHRREDVRIMACLECWHLGQYPQGFNFKGCQLAHITPSLQGFAYGGYGAVGDYEGDKR